MYPPRHGPASQRPIPRQSKPYKKLVEVTTQQPLFNLGNTSGTIVALRCPYFVKGVNVPGYHMHFITSDRSRGGHLLGCTIKSGTAIIDTTSDFILSLPKSDDFYRTDFAADNQEDLKKVEQGNR